MQSLCAVATSGMNNLPGEIIALLSLHLSASAITHFSQASKAVNSALRKDNFWKALYTRDYAYGLRKVKSADWNLNYKYTYAQHMLWLSPNAQLKMVQSVNLNNRLVASAYHHETRTAFTGGWDMPVREFIIDHDLNMTDSSSYKTGEENTGRYYGAFSGSASLSVSDRLVMTGLYNGKLLIFDRNEKTLLRTLSKVDTPGTHELRSIQFDTEKIVCASEDTHIKVWDIETGALIQHFADPDATKCWTASFDNATHLCLYGNGASKVVAVDMRTWTVVKSFDTKKRCEGVKSLQFDQEKVLCGTMQGSMHVFDWQGTELFKFETERGLNYVEQVYFDPVKIVTADFHNITVIDPRSYQIVNQSPMHETRGLSIQDDFAVVGFDKKIGVFKMGLGGDTEPNLDNLNDSSASDEDALGDQNSWTDD